MIAVVISDGVVFGVIALAALLMFIATLPNTEEEEE